MIDPHDAVKRMILQAGDDPSREGLIDTPKRVVKAYAELFSGYGKNPADLMRVFEDGACDEMVILKNIEFYSMCEHHMLPFFGKVDIGYLPRGKVIGVSKLARVVDMFARRLQVQERMTAQIADCLMEHLQPNGVIVVSTAVHLCMVSRGVGKQNSKMTTSAIRGAFENNVTRSEFMSLCAEQ